MKNIMQIMQFATTAPFKLGLLLLLMSGMEAVAGEYTIVLESLKVLQADEFTIWDRYCASEFKVKIKQGDHVFERYLECKKENLPLELRFDNKEIRLPTYSDIYVDIEEDDTGSCCDDQLNWLAYAADGTPKSYQNCQIALDKYKGKHLTLKFTGIGGWDDRERPLEVELKLHIKQEIFELQPKFISQIQRYIPVGEQIKFIKDLVRPHSHVNLKFQDQKITGTKTSPFFYKTDDNNKFVVPPYLKWETTARASLRFPNQAPVNLIEVGEEGIALPILQWLTKKGGVLVFATDEPNGLFSLSKLAEHYNRSDDYILPKKPAQHVVVVTLPKEIVDKETLKKLLSYQNSLTIHYEVDGVPLSQTIKASDVGTMDGGVEVLLPFGDYEPKNVTVIGAGIFSFFSLTPKQGESLSFNTQLKKSIDKKTVYPSHYVYQDECKPLETFSISQLVEKIIYNQIELAEGSIKIDCPYLVTATLNPQLIKGKIVLDLTQVETLQVQFLLGDEVAKEWWVISESGESKQLSDHGMIDLAELPPANSLLTLAPPANLIILASKSVTDILEQGNAKMEKNALRWQHNPLTINLGEPEERGAESHIAPISVWSKIQLSIKPMDQKPKWGCSIGDDARIICPKAQNLKLQDLQDVSIAPMGFESRRKTQIKAENLIDIYCGRWDRLFGEKVGLDIIVPNATWTTSKRFKIGFGTAVAGAEVFELIDQSHQVPMVWSFYDEWLSFAGAKAIVVGDGEGNRLVLEGKSSILLENENGELVPAMLESELIQPQCR